MPECLLSKNAAFLDNCLASHRVCYIPGGSATLLKLPEFLKK